MLSKNAQRSRVVRRLLWVSTGVHHRTGSSSAMKSFDGYLQKGEPLSQVIALLATLTPGKAFGVVFYVSLQ